MTAFMTSDPTKASAISFILMRTMDDTSSGLNCFCSPMCVTLMCGFPPTPGTTEKGHCVRSLCTHSSSNLRPIRRFASYTVFAELKACWFLAGSPMRRPSSVNAT